MAETLVAILTAHLLGDFIFQTGWMVKRKRHIAVLLLHVAIVTLTSWLLLGTGHWSILTIIFLTHFSMDAVKAYMMTDSLTSFLVDQAVHLAALVGLAVAFPGAAQNGWWGTSLDPDLRNCYFASLSCLSGLILVVPAGGILIGKATGRFLEEIGENNIRGLKKGGQYIGWLERFLVMLFLLIDQPSGIGFLVAAKSILRFGEIKDDSQRKVTEYIIIGTFLSFGWALLISAMTQQAIHHWLPP